MSALADCSTSTAGKLPDFIHWQSFELSKNAATTEELSPKLTFLSAKIDFHPNKQPDSDLSEFFYTTRRCGNLSDWSELTTLLREGDGGFNGLGGIQEAMAIDRIPAGLAKILGGRLHQPLQRPRVQVRVG